jgi:hypothetical protein
MALEFAGAAIPLSDADIAAAAEGLGIEPAVIAAVAEVESAGSGFLPDKRPKILYEAHVFGRLTLHRFDAEHPDISAPSWDRSLYGAAGAHQYDRLHRAMALDRLAALQSASWGRFQILALNWKEAGYPDVERFVSAMCASEAEHLKAFIGFCGSKDIIRFLAVHNWRSFVKVYNGPGQVDLYSARLEAAYSKNAARAWPKSDAEDTMPNAVSPFEKIKAIQLVLGVKQDGAFGKISLGELNAALKALGQRLVRFV